MSTLVGTTGMIRLILRRDRLRIPLWFGLSALYAVVVLASVGGTYPSDAARLAFAETTNGNPAQLMMIGPVFDSSPAGIGAWRIRGQLAILLALASLLLVVRHTRAEEEAGRSELVGSTVVGRHATLTATLVVAFSANVAAAALMTLGLAAQGLPLRGSLTLALSFAAAGWVFAAVATVAAQVSDGARTAVGISAAVLGAWYLVRAIADLGEIAWLSWLTPFGWTQRMRPYAGDRWWPLALVAVLVILLVAVAFLLASRRDIGRGLIPARLGPAAAAPRLRSPLALAWRLHRGMLYAWTAGTTLFGAALGVAAQGIAEQLRESTALAALIERMGTDGRPVDGFFALIIYLLSQVVTVYAIQATLRMRGEELATRADMLLTGPVGRWRWAVSHLTVAAVGSAVVLAGLGIGIGLAYGLATGDVGGELPPLFAAAVVRLPSVLVLAAVAAAVYGLRPQLAAITAYTALVGCFALEFAVEFFGASEALMTLSPFAQTPALPGGAFSVVPLFWLTLLVAALVAVGLAGFRRRDIG